jgi:hypothetical protein
MIDFLLFSAGKNRWENDPEPALLRIPVFQAVPEPSLVASGVSGSFVFSTHKNKKRTIRI